MRDNLFHASTAESIRSRHAETYLWKMRSANAGGTNATTAGLNSSIPEESRISRFCRFFCRLSPGFRLPTESLRYFILLTGTGGERQRLPSPKRGRCNLSRNHFYRSVISSPKARTRLRPYRVVGVLVSLRFALHESDKSEVALGKNVASALQLESVVYGYRRDVIYFIWRSTFPDIFNAVALELLILRICCVYV